MEKEIKKKKNNNKINKNNSKKGNNKPNNQKYKNESKNTKKVEEKTKEVKKVKEKNDKIKETIVIDEQEEVKVEDTIETENKETSKEKFENDNDKETVEIIESKEVNQLEETTNKKGLIFLLALLLIIVGVCVYYQLDNKEKTSNTEVSEKESNQIMDNFYEYFKSKDAKIIYYASSTCGYCSLQTPIMEQIDKDYDIDYLYIDSSKLTTSDRETVLKELNIDHATPTTVVVKNGKVVDTQIGYVEGAQMVEFLINSKILDKDAVYTPEQYLTMIDYSQYKELIAKEGTYVVTIGQTGCSHCIATKPVLNTIAKDYNIEMNYLNLTNMTESEKNDFYSTLTDIEYNEESFVSKGSIGTPLTLIIQNGKVVSYINGEKPTSQYITKLKKVGLISK